MTATPRMLPSGRYQGSYRDATGKWITKTFPTKSAARRWAADGETAVRQGTHRNPRGGRVLFRDWHARWLDNRVVEASTHRKDRSYSQGVLARWGDVHLDAILRVDIQGWVAQQVAAKRGVHAIDAEVQMLSSVLEMAVAENLLPHNPARKLTLPPSQYSPDRLVTPDEEVALLAAFRQPVHRWMVEVMFDTGLRWGEAAGLHGHRVDLLRGELQVVEVMTQLGKVKEYPKSRRSRRTVPLTPRATLALAQSMERWGRDGLVFRTMGLRPGAVMYGANFRKVWVAACEAAGLSKPWPTPHDTRHTVASRLVAAGVDVATVQQLLGHESLQTTQRYVHVTPGARERVLSALSGPVVADLSHEAREGRTPAG